MFLRYRLRSDLERYSYHQLDLNRDMDRILALLDSERPACIVNFAAQSEVAPSWVRPEHWFETNCVALARLTNHLKKSDYLRRYVHISSPEAYGSCSGSVYEDCPFNPSTPYAASKASADLLLSTYYKQFGYPLLTVRSTNVYGARQQLFKIIPRAAIYLKAGKRIELHGGGHAVKSYIHVRDVSRGELAILERGRVGEVYHLSPDTGIAVCDVVRLICERMGKNFSDFTLTVGERPGQDAAYLLNSDKARRELCWRPQVPIDEGLAEVIRWVDEYWAQISESTLEYQHKA
jgi:dTDP-glucose 4,6-dehydratase